MRDFQWGANCVIENGNLLKLIMVLRIFYYAVFFMIPIVVQPLIPIDEKKR